MSKYQGREVTILRDADAGPNDNPGNPNSGPNSNPGGHSTTRGDRGDRTDRGDRGDGRAHNVVIRFDDEPNKGSEKTVPRSEVTPA